MKSNSELLDDFSVNVSRYLDATHDERREAALMYACRDARPFVSGGAQNQAYKLDRGINGSKYDAGTERKPSLFVASIAPAYLRAAIGMVMKGRKNFDAYSVDPTFRGEIDRMNDGMNWAATKSRFDAQLGLAFEDTAVRGVGGLVTYLDFSHKHFPFGAPVCQRKYHLFYDRGGMEDVSSGNTLWCGYADPIYRRNLDDYIEENGGFEDGSAGASFRDEFLEYTTSTDRVDIDFVYHYFWREWADVYDVENPFVTRPQELINGVQIAPEVMELLANFAKTHQIDIIRSSILTLDKDAHQSFRAMIDNFEALTGRKLEGVVSNKRRARCYYRCQIADGQIIKGTKSMSYTRECHPLNIITAYYDRSSGTHYGLMRAAAYLQEALNDVMGDSLEYSRRAATGGTVALTGIGTELKDTIQSIRNREQAFPMPEGGSVTGLQTQDAAAVYQNTAALLIKLIPMTMGLPPEIIGMMNNDTPAAELFKQVVEQMSVSLAHIMHSVDVAVYNQGLIFRDMILEIANTTDSVVLPAIAPNGEPGELVQLSQDNIARDYALRIIEKDDGEDERHNEFMKLVEFAQMLPEQQRAAVLPEFLMLSNFDEDTKDRIAQLLQPQPIDPAVAQAQIAQQEANARMINAQAAQLEGEAMISQQRAPTEMQEALSKIENQMADTQKKLAEVEKVQAETMKTEIEAGAKAAESDYQPTT